MNKSKNIGTEAETAVVRYLRKNGFPGAERRALSGNVDKGDIAGVMGVVIEVKSGKAAENASDGQIGKWIEETLTEQANAHADKGVLVVKRAGKGEAQVGSWWAIHRGPVILGGPWVTQRWLLDEYVQWLRFCGYGDPL